MLLLDLNPIMDASIIDDLNYVGKFLLPGTRIETRQVAGGPFTIQSELDDVHAAYEVVKVCIQAEKDGFDGIFVNCFGDPGVRAARQAVNIPVFGGFEPVMHLTMGLADKIAIISVLKSVIPLIRGSVERACLQERVCCIREVGIPVHDLDDIEKLIAALTEQSLLALRNDGAEAIVLGCTAMVDVAERIKINLLQEGYHVPVVEAAQAAVTLLETQVRMGLLQSRVTYGLQPYGE
ncbi:MAG: aspartate/glutamate racemase family protein [Clostridiales Family XIII bacterium]|jgi:allantoin racemase|nr:aspartate/glutamate racemase family protein [Clostridiales Family XIII bacterium]